MLLLGVGRVWSDDFSWLSVVSLIWHTDTGTHVRVHTHTQTCTHGPFLSSKERQLLTGSPELPPSSNHQLEFLWSGLVISLMLLLAACYRFHYCRSMQSPCEVGEEWRRRRKGERRASYSRIYQPAFAHRKSSWRGLGCCWNSHGRKGLGSCNSDWKEIWKPFFSEQQQKCWVCFCIFVFVWWCALPSWLAIVLSGYRSCFQCRTPLSFYFLWVSLFFISPCFLLSLNTQHYSILFWLSLSG